MTILPKLAIRNTPTLIKLVLSPGELAHTPCAPRAAPWARLSCASTGTARHSLSAAQCSTPAAAAANPHGFAISFPLELHEYWGLVCQNPPRRSHSPRVLPTDCPCSFIRCRQLAGEAASPQDLDHSILMGISPENSTRFGLHTRNQPVPEGTRFGKPPLTRGFQEVNDVATTPVLDYSPSLG